MTKRPILPLEIYEFMCCNELLEDARRSLGQLQWVSNDKNLISYEPLNTTPAFRDLHAWFQSCINEVQEDLNLPFERLKITQSWANKTITGQSHHAHTHPNSYMSGILYLTTAEEGSTEFYSLNPWFDFFLILIDADRQYANVFRQKPIAGKLLLFPSKLEHCVQECVGEAPRFTVSFNVFPEGRFDHKPGTRRFLELSVTPYRLMEGDDCELSASRKLTDDRT